MIEFFKNMHINCTIIYFSQAYDFDIISTCCTFVTHMKKVYRHFFYQMTSFDWFGSLFKNEISRIIQSMS